MMVSRLVNNSEVRRLVRVSREHHACEQLIVQLALFSGMRPGEILALQWKHVAEDHVQVVHRLYRGKLDRPKSERSKREVALSGSTRKLIAQWRRKGNPDPEAWVFPSA